MFPNRDCSNSGVAYCLFKSMRRVYVILCVCVCVCVFVCVRVCVRVCHIYIYIHTHVYIHTYRHAYIHTYMCVCVHGGGAREQLAAQT
jgi:hypothetical protein